MRFKRIAGLGAAAAAALALTLAPAAHAAGNPNAPGTAAAAPAAAMTQQPAVLTPAEQTAVARLGATPASASSWYIEYLISQHNGLCARGQTATHLAPIDVYPCAANEEAWECRVLNTFNGWNWNLSGVDVECVDPSYSFMFGESGGAYKMQTPNASDFIENTGYTGTTVTGQNYDKMLYYPNNNYFGSGPAGTQLGVETSEPNGYGWTFCANTSTWCGT